MIDGDDLFILLIYSFLFICFTWTEYTAAHIKITARQQGTMS